MYYVLPIVLAVFSSYAYALDCGENGRVLACPCTRTCSNPQGPHFCPCIEGCSCNRGFLLNEKTQKCVLPEQCPLDALPTTPKPVCGANSHLDPCPCKKTCDNPAGPSYCACNEGCTCDDGYVLDELTEKCVKTYDCKKINLKVELSCGANSHIDPCPCKKTCSDPSGPIVCTCHEGCQCDVGYLLSDSDNTCIPEKQCPNKTGDGLNFSFETLFKLFDFDDDPVPPMPELFTGQPINKPSSTKTSTTTSTTPKTTTKVASSTNVANSSTYGPQDILIIFDDSTRSPSHRRRCHRHSHFEMCPCEKTCTKPKGPELCPCIQGCQCDDGYLKHEGMNRCVTVEECSQLTDDVKKSSVVYKRSFLSWCFSPEEPMHIFFSLLVCCLMVAIIFSLINIKKRRPLHGKIIQN